MFQACSIPEVWNVEQHLAAFRRCGKHVDGWQASLCFLPVYVELARKVSAFGFCSIPIAFTPLVLGGAASAKRRFGLLSKMQTEETVFTFFTVCDGEIFGFTTAVEAGSCSSAAHAVK